MALIKPFKGLCYRLETPGDLARFISPPYDMVDDAMIDALYCRDPLNVVRIIQNKPQEADSANKDRHRRAAGLLRQWIGNGTLVRDKSPSVYVYRQQFDIARREGAVTYTRTGVIVLVKLVDYEEGVVFPHEYTLTGPKIDRYELLQATRSNTELVFGIVPDPDGGLFSGIERAVPEECRGYCVDENKVRHSLYCNSDPAVAASLTKVMSERTILIADGHHRYETGLQFARETGNPGHAFIMINLVSMADPGLIIRAFHRIVKKGAAAETIDLLDALSAYFDTTDLGPASLDVVSRFLADTSEGHEMLYLDARSKHCFGLTLSASGRRYLEDHHRGMSMQWNRLDVSKINSIVVGGIFHLPLDGKVLHDVMDYVNDAGVAFEKAFSHEGYHGAFFIRPVDIGTVTAIVSGKERMPQKSTNFFPKCYSGLVFNTMESQ